MTAGAAAPGASRSRRRAVLRGACAAALLACVGAAGAAGAAPCPGGGIEVMADDPALVPRVCAVAEGTSATLAGCGLPHAAPLTIAVVDRLPAGCMGVFHCGARRIEVLAPPALAARRVREGAFAAIPDGAYFDSVVAHEVAHAAHDAVPCPFGTCEVTAEYVAYATQIRSLPAAARSAFLEAAGVGQARRDDLSLMLLRMAPETFAATAALHLAGRPDDCAYLAAIGRGDIVLDRDRP